MSSETSVLRSAVASPRVLPLFRVNPSGNLWLWLTHFCRHKALHQISPRPFRVKSCRRPRLTFGFLVTSGPLHSHFYDHLDWPTLDREIVKDQILFLIVRLSRNLIEVGRVRVRPPQPLRVFNFTTPGTLNYVPANDNDKNREFVHYFLSHIKSLSGSRENEPNECW